MVEKAKNDVLSESYLTDYREAELLKKLSFIQLQLCFGNYKTKSYKLCVFQILLTKNSPLINNCRHGFIIAFDNIHIDCFIHTVF